MKPDRSFASISLSACSVSYTIIYGAIKTYCLLRLLLLVLTPLSLLLHVYNLIDVRIIIMMFLYLNASNVQKNAQLAYNLMIIVSHAKEIIEL